MGEVSFIHRRSLVSSKPIQPGKKIPLTTLDLIMEKHHIKMVYYFATPKGSIVGEMTERLRESLAEVLSYFHKVTGRLMKDDNGRWMIKCNDAGVRFVEARAKGSVETWLENVDEEREKMLSHWEDVFHIPYFWATFYIKVTEFEEGGLAVGLGCSHMLADPLSAAQFVKSWADIALYGKMHVPPFVHPLPQRILGYESQDIKPSSHLIDHYKFILESPSSSPSSSTAQSFLTVVLRFPSEMVQACMDLVESNTLTKGCKPTPFTTLGGLLWACISRVKEATNGFMNVSVSLNVRKNLGLDTGYFGNCMVYNRVNTNDISVDDLSNASMAIGEAIEKMEKEGIMDLIEWLEHYEHDLCLPSLLGDCEDNLVFVNLEDVNYYSTMFVESFEPIRVSCYIEPFVWKRKVAVLPSHPHEGILSRQVMVTLPNDEVIKLCDDKFLANFSPIILMGPKHTS